jgi:anthranilate synthase component II
MMLLLDNYDSFVHNVERALRELGEDVMVVRSDGLTVAEALALPVSRVVISPGPRTPAEAGISVELVRAVGERIPVLGICLGHQAVAAAYGGAIVPSPEPAHGWAVPVFHRGSGLLQGIPSPFPAGLYHSLSVGSDSLPVELVVEGWTRGGEVMAIRHRNHSVWGVQFHPESILTPAGMEVFRNFLAIPSGGHTTGESPPTAAGTLVAGGGG